MSTLGKRITRGHDVTDERETRNRQTRNTNSTTIYADADSLDETIDGDALGFSNQLIHYEIGKIGVFVFLCDGDITFSFVFDKERQTPPSFEIEFFHGSKLAYQYNTDIDGTWAHDDLASLWTLSGQELGNLSRIRVSF
jgi:hypothetical protein